MSANRDPPIPTNIAPNVTLKAWAGMVDVPQGMATDKDTAIAEAAGCSITAS